MVGIKVLLWRFVRLGGRLNTRLTPKIILDSTKYSFSWPIETSLQLLTQSQSLAAHTDRNGCRYKTVLIGDLTVFKSCTENMRILKSAASYTRTNFSIDWVAFCLQWEQQILLLTLVKGSFSIQTPSPYSWGKRLLSIRFLASPAHYMKYLSTMLIGCVDSGYESEQDDGQFAL